MIVHDMPMVDYHAHPALNSTKIKAVVNGEIQKFKAMKDGTWNEKASEPQVLGTAVHELLPLLQNPDKFNQICIECPDYGAKRSNEAKQNYADFYELHKDKLVLEKKSFDVLQKIAKAAKDHFNLRFLLASCKSEVTGFITDEYGDEYRARADLLGTNWIWDFKTISSSMSDLEIYRAIIKFGYHISAVHYLKVFNQLTDNQYGNNFGWVFLESNPKSEFTRIRLLKCPELLINKATILYDDAINKIRECRETGLYQDFSDEIEELKLPRWENE
jgi:PDDEXK-like domain of unknown function (DUF3799)